MYQCLKWLLLEMVYCLCFLHITYLFIQPIIIIIQRLYSRNLINLSNWKYQSHQLSIKSLIDDCLDKKQKSGFGFISIQIIDL